MENKAPQNPVAQQADDAQDILARAKANSKRILVLSVFVLAVIAAILIWFFVAKAGSAKADEAVGRADVAPNDSVALVLYKEAAQKGYKSGNRAKVEAGIRLYQQGKYQEALDYLKDASVDDNIVAAGVYTLEGDCYVNLKQYPEALKAFDKAVSKAGKNPSIVPLVLIKKANVLRAEKNYEGEAEALRTIVEQYPQFMQTSQVDVRKLYERAKASAGK